MPTLLSIVPTLLFVIWLAPIFPFLYVVVRWRAAGRSEPGIGSYSLVLFFMSGAVLVAATAISVLLYVMLSEDSHDELVRAMWGLLGSSLVFFGLQVMVGRSLAPSEDASAATRTFGGFVMALSGLVVFVALTAVCVAMTMDTEPMSARALENRTDMMKAAGSGLGVFGMLYLAIVRGMR